MSPTATHRQLDVTVDPEVFAQYPGLRLGLIAVPVGAYERADDARGAERDLLARLRSAFPDEDALRARPEDEAYRVFYRAMGLKAAQVSTPVKQAARVLRSGEYRSRGPAIDVAMSIEYATLVSFQLYDADALPAELAFRLARGDEPIATMRREEKVCKAGELLLVGGEAVVHSCYYGNDRAFVLGERTRSALVRVMGIPGVPERAFADAVAETQASLGAANALLLDVDTAHGRIAWAVAQGEEQPCA